MWIKIQTVSTVYTTYIIPIIYEIIKIKQLSNVYILLY